VTDGNTAATAFARGPAAEAVLAQPPGTVQGRLRMTEQGEMIARRYGDQSEKPSDAALDLGDELADVLWVVLALANQTQIDLTSALQRNIDKKTSRDATRHRDNEKLR
jgi:phosphoenolpyruvate carboxylase